MAIGVSSRLRSYLRRKLEKTKKCGTYTSKNTTSTSEVKDLAEAPTPQAVEIEVAAPKPKFDQQHDSSFFQKLPLEIRKMVYSYVWRGAYDHKYHESNGRHLHFKDGHWVHTRCVMFQEDDEDPDRIQKYMDLIQHDPMANLLLWQRRLASAWGQRHWRCEERIEYGKPTSIDRTDLGALMVVCKKMHPEVMESFLESHKMIFNDIFSAHRFLAQPASSRLIRHLRRLDLTLSASFHELAPFLAIGRPDTEDHHNDDDEEDVDAVAAAEIAAAGSPGRVESSNRLVAIFAALARHPTCLHSLQVSLDVYDRGPWRKLPERALAPHLARIPVRRGRGGQANYTVQLPAALPIPTHYAGLQELVGEDEEAAAAAASCCCEGGTGTTTTTTTTMTMMTAASMQSLPFAVTRRPPLRYWQFSPGGPVEPFTWATRQSERRHRHCWIAPSKTTRPIANPYLLDFTER